MVPAGTQRFSHWSDRRFVAAVAAAVLLLRLTYLDRPLFADEAGYYLVARDWHAGGPNLYGHYFVDRPPLLIAVYALSALAHWDPFVRLIAGGFAVLMVIAAAWAADAVVGPRGVRWAAVTAAALAVTPLLALQEADGELFAAPVVMLAVAALLSAVRHRSVPRAAVAGFAAGCAVLFKQNFADAVVFGVLFLSVSMWQRRLAVRDGLRLLLGAALGGAASAAGAGAYVVWSRVGLAEAWTSLVGFRSRALDVIEDHSLHAALLRGVELLGLSLLCGLLPLLVLLVLEAARCRFRGAPVGWAVGGALVWAGLSIAVGGSYWPHYLLELAPMTALAAGLWAPDSARLRSGVAIAVVSALAATGAVVLSGARYVPRGRDVGQWVQASARRGDTATVLFGNAEVQEASGLRSPYTHLWTLPMRTFDPRLAQLRRLLDGPRAPTWLVTRGDLDPWHIDPRGRLRRAVAVHYRPVGRVCGHVVYLRDGVQRHLAPRPAGCRAVPDA